MVRSDESALELAALFCLVHRGTPGDVGYYVEAVRGCSQVLELGCGAGRVLAPIAESGTPIVGLERNAAMVAAGRTRWLANLPPHARVLLGDMRSFDLRERFDAVLIPYNALFALDTDDDIRNTLEAARQHLVDGGSLHLDCYALEDPPAGGRLSEQGFVRVGTYIDQGRRIEVQECEGTEEPGRRFAMRYRYRVHELDGSTRVVEDAVRHHYVPPALLLELVEDAGFRVEHVFGGFDESEVDEDSVIRVIAARASKPRSRARARIATAV